MPLRRCHDTGHDLDVSIRDTILKQITHGIHEDQFRRPPQERLEQFLWNKPQIESLLVGMSLHAAKALRKRFGITMLTTGANLDTPAHWVPRRICPLDWR